VERHNLAGALGTGIGGLLAISGSLLRKQLNPDAQALGQIWKIIGQAMVVCGVPQMLWGMRKAQGAQIEALCDLKRDARR
jgi:hypothetical protein